MGSPRRPTCSAQAAPRGQPDLAAAAPLTALRGRRVDSPGPRPERRRGLEVGSGSSFPGATPPGAQGEVDFYEPFLSFP